MKQINYKKILISWALLSILPIGILVISFYTQTGKTLTLMLNFTNLVLFVCALSFQKKIKGVIQSILNDFDSVNEKPTKISFKVLDNHEIILGIFLLSFVILFGSYMIYISITDVPLYTTLIWEDGPVEYASAILWVLAAIVLFIYAIKQKFQKTLNFSSLPYTVLIIFSLLCAGEEISWGQRLLKIPTPEFLKSINVQNETTLHNIGSTSFFSNLFFLLTLFFFIAIPILVRKHDKFKHYLNHYSFPIPNRFAIYIFVISLVIWIIIGVRFGTLGFHPYKLFHYKSQMDDEFFEFLAAYSFFAFSIFDSLKTKVMKNSI